MIYIKIRFFYFVGFYRIRLGGYKVIRDKLGYFSENIY